MHCLETFVVAQQWLIMAPSLAQAALLLQKYYFVAALSVFRT
jgi:hypothetical protein